MKLELFTTNGTGRDREPGAILEFTKDCGEENHVVNLYPNARGQVFEGFGGAVTDAAGAVFSRMNEDQKTELLKMYFSGQGMDYQMVRIPMDSCDFSTHVYTAMDLDDPELSDFSFLDTEKYILPFLRAAEKMAGRKLEIMLSAWSPPAFMKTNGERQNGGTLKSEYRALWAKYLCRYILEFEKRGFHVACVTVQNEPNAVQTWDSCIFTSSQEKEFIKDFLYPELIGNGLQHVGIYIWDHNKERIYERALQVIDPETDSMIEGIAFHWYSGDHFEALDLVREQYPLKKLVLSESCLEFSKYNKEDEFVNAQRLVHDLIGNLNHGMHRFYDWNLLLNQEGGPNYVGNYCDAPYLYNEETKVLTGRKILSCYWHFSHFIRRGAVKIGQTRYSHSLNVTAWENRDGSVAAVLQNLSAENMPCILRINGQVAKIDLEANSITTGVIRQEN